MDVVTPIITQLQMPILMHPTLRTLHHPAVYSQTTSMWSVPFGQHRLRSSGPELSSVRLGVVTTIALHAIEAMTRTASLATHARHRIHQRKQLRHVNCCCVSLRR